MGAKPSDLGGEVIDLIQPSAARRQAEQRGRRAEALSLALAGFSHEQIAERLGISEEGVDDLLDRTLGRVANRHADKLRELENARLDRVQAGIWTQVISGDLKAIDAFLRISARRARMNGLDEPTKVNLSINVRAEMEQALAALESTVLGMVVDADPDEEPRAQDD